MDGLCFSSAPGVPPFGYAGSSGKTPPLFHFSSDGRTLLGILSWFPAGLFPPQMNPDTEACFTRGVFFHSLSVSFFTILYLITAPLANLGGFFTLLEFF